MNKTEALTRLDALEAEARKLREITDAPESMPALLPPDGTCTISTCLGRFVGFASKYSSVDLDETNRFPDVQTATDYAHAINTLLLLRHQPGTVPAKEHVTQWVVECDPAYLNQLKANSFTQACIKLSKLSPCFDSPNAAAAAIDIVGQDAILRMFRTFHHFKE